VTATPARDVIALLTAQALAFGVMLALLIIPANALFLNAYGSKWLPATYIAIAVFDTGASALIARAAHHREAASWRSALHVGSALSPFPPRCVWLA
jgi:hypothetical protein